MSFRFCSGVEFFQRDMIEPFWFDPPPQPFGLSPKTYHASVVNRNTNMEPLALVENARFRLQGGCSST